MEVVCAHNMPKLKHTPAHTIALHKQACQALADCTVKSGERYRMMESAQST